MRDPRLEGALAAYRHLGLEKQAVDYVGLGRKALQGTGRFLFGQPREFASQFRRGVLHKPGGLLRAALNPPGAFDKALLYGMPAFTLYQALSGPAEERGTMAGRALGEFAGSLVGMPLGVVGLMGGAALGGTLGGTMGSVFDKKRPVPDVQELGRWTPTP